MKSYINLLKRYTRLVVWYINGKNMPPPLLLKHLIIMKFKNRSNSQYLIETGTYLGETVSAMLNKFYLIYSIELNKELYSNAVCRFKNNNNVKLYYGDSGKVLSEVLGNIKGQAIFWLDGHYSGAFTSRGDEDYPLLSELEQIRNHAINDHIILIDDARLFTGIDRVPSINEIILSLRLINQQYVIDVKNDVIRAYVA